MATPKNQPWDRREKESATAYEAARHYFEMGADRSIDAVSRKLAKSLPFLKRWSSRHRWVERARAYDDHRARIDADAKDRAARLGADRWAARNEQDREANWTLGNAARQQAGNQLLVAGATKKAIDPNKLKALVDAMLGASKMTAQAVAPGGVVDQGASPGAGVARAGDAARVRIAAAMVAAGLRLADEIADGGPDG